MSPREAGPRLGRGLAALLGEQGPAPLTAARTVAVHSLQPGPFQPRGPMDQAALVELADSIRLQGMLQPILVRPMPGQPNSFQIIAGERRWRAAQQAGLHEVPVFLRDMADSDAMAAALVENLQRENLNALEEADGYRRLLEEFGLTQEKLAEVVGKSRSHVANMLRLLNLPQSVQGSVRRGELSAGHARALLAHPEPEKAALAVMTRGLNVRQTEALAQGRASPVEPTVQARDPELKRLEQSLSERLGLRVEITSAGAAGSVRINYRSLDQLDGLLALLLRS